MFDILNRYSYTMEEQTNLDAGIIASEEETATTGINVEEVNTNEVYTKPIESEDTIESEEEIDKEALKKKRNAEKAKELLHERTQLKSRIAELEKVNAIKDLKIKYGEFDENLVVGIKTDHPSLSYEDSYLLYKSKNPTQVEEKPIEFWGFVWRESQGSWITKITTKELASIKDSNEYSKTYDLIQSGKIQLVKG